ncbi:MAG: TRAM domain-containing protein [Armatimonadetes bacterium]|nr:TRAM domain-containing protein [Armatimonadota bacterium]
MALLGVIVGGAVGNLLSVWWVRWAIDWEGMEIGDKVSFFIGVFAGIVASLPFLFVFQGLPGVLAPLLTIALVLGFTTVSIYALKSMDEILPWQKQTMSYRRTGRKILDTNVIIDGRILDVARTGFLEGEVYVPKFVIEELQHIADSADPLRRQRGRRGLEILRVMQSEFDLKVGVHDHKIESGGEVDARLVKLAKALGGDLVSNDFNLNKVAGLQDVNVLNINDLALSLRPNVLPGEKLEITIIREGSQPGQGVGYLDDGTMVVVEEGKSFIGETVDVAVTQVIQTERGKMIFADDPGTHAHGPEEPKTNEHVTDEPEMPAPGRGDDMVGKEDE